MPNNSGRFPARPRVQARPKPRATATSVMAQAPNAAYMPSWCWAGVMRRHLTAHGMSTAIQEAKATASSPARHPPPGATINHPRPIPARKNRANASTAAPTATQQAGAFAQHQRQGPVATAAVLFELVDLGQGVERREERREGREDQQRRTVERAAGQRPPGVRGQRAEAHHVDDPVHPRHRLEPEGRDGIQHRHHEAEGVCHGEGRREQERQRAPRHEQPPCRSRRGWPAPEAAGGGSRCPLRPCRTQN